MNEYVFIPLHGTHRVDSGSDFVPAVIFIVISVTICRVCKYYFFVAFHAIYCRSASISFEL